MRAEAERARLGQWIRAGSTPQQVVLRSRIILAAAAGESDIAIAEALAVSRATTAF